MTAMPQIAAAGGGRRQEEWVRSEARAGRVCQEWGAARERECRWVNREHADDERSRSTHAAMRQAFGAWQSS